MKKKRNYLLVLALFVLFKTILPCYAGGGSDDSSSENQNDDITEEIDYSFFSDSELIGMAEEAEENGDIDTADEINEILDTRRCNTISEVEYALMAYEAAREAYEFAERQGVTDSDVIQDLEDRCEQTYNALSDAIDAYNAFNDAISSYDYSSFEERENIAITNIGDPVDIGTGAFLIDKNDLGIIRKYCGGNVYDGSFGSVWFCSLDTRLIRGTDSKAADALKKIEDSLSVMQSTYDSIASDSAQYSECSEFLLKMQALLTKTINNRDELKNRVQKSNEAVSYNAFTAYGPLSSSIDCGTDYFIYISENGESILFKKDSEHLWTAVSDFYKQFYTLQSLDNDEFLVSSSKGTSWYFSKYGLPLKKVLINGETIFYESENGYIVSVKKSGNHFLSINRNSNGKILSINSDNKNTISYSYDGKMLSSVCDTENDIWNFQYKDNYIAKYYSPDGSVLSLEYTEPNINGLRKTSATINEEGFRETFEYNESEKKIIHTDYSKVKTVCFYDSKGRTIKVQRSDGSFDEYEYDSIGNLIQKRNNFGRTSFVYDEKGRLVCSSFEDGSQKKYVFNDSGLLKSYTNRDGICFQYYYDEKGNCNQVYCAGKLIVSLKYDLLNRCISKCFASGREETFLYDQRNNCIQKTFSGTERNLFCTYTEYFEYDEYDRMIVHTDFAGRKSFYSYKSHSVSFESPEKLQTVFITDAAKNLVSKIETDLLTNETRRFDISYNKMHLPTEVFVSGIMQDGTVVEKQKKYSVKYNSSGKMWQKITYGNDHSSSILEEYEYNLSGNISSIKKCRIDISENEIKGTVVKDSFSYKIGDTLGISILNAANNEYSIFFDENGFALKKILPSGTELISEYSPSGRILREQNNFGGFYSYNYDFTNGLLQDFGEESGKRKSVTYNQDGLISSYINELGSLVECDHDLFGRILSEKNDNSQVDFYYDKIGRCIQKKVTDLQSGKICFILDYKFSEDGRNLEIIAGNRYRTQYEFNAWHEFVSIKDSAKQIFTYSPDGLIISLKDANQNVSSFFYDACGKVSEVKNPDGNITKFEYNADGKVLRQIDSEGIIVQENTYDECGRLKTVRKRPGAEYSYEYDVDGNVSAILCDGKIITSYKYQQFNLKVDTFDANQNVFSQKFDHFGRKISETNRNNKSHFFEYDDLGRKISETSFSGKKTTFKYTDKSKTLIFDDNSQQLIEYDVLGNIIHVKSPDSELFYEYDKGGQLVKVIDVLAGSEILYSYDEFYRCTKKTGAGCELHYSYDDCGRILSVQDKKTFLSVNFLYDACGREIQKTYGNGIKCLTKYDKAGRIIYYQVFKDYSLLFAKGYIYDSDAHLSHEVMLSGEVNRFVSNGENKLSSAEYFDTEGESIMRFSGSEYSAISSRIKEMSNGKILYCSVVQNARKSSFEYDKNGNLSSKITGELSEYYSYDNENQLLHVKKDFSNSENSGDLFCTWDLDGNLISKTDSVSEQYFSYNLQNRMKSFVTNNLISGEQKTSEYSYDVFGRRNTTMSNNGVTLRSVYDGFSLECLVKMPSFNGTSIMNSSLLQKSNNSVQGYRYLSEENDLLIENSNRDLLQTEQNNYSESSDFMNVFLYANGSCNAVFSEDESSYFVLGRHNSVEMISSETTFSEPLKYEAFSKFNIQINFTNTNLPCYNGKSIDSSSGLLDFGFRDFDSDLNIFTTPDPIRDGRNWYSFCAGNPIDYCDLLGLDVWDGILVTNDENRISLDFIDYIDSRLEGLKDLLLSGDAVVNLSNTQNKTMTATIYFPNGGGNYHYLDNPILNIDKTWCNQSTFDITRAVGFNVEVLLNGVRQYDVDAASATINIMKHAAEPMSTIMEVSPVIAQVFANSGVCVVGVLEGSNHIATVSPIDLNTSRTPAGPTIANVGQTNGIQSARSAFGMRYDEGLVHFYIDTQQKTDFDDSQVAARLQK